MNQRIIIQDGNMSFITTLYVSDRKPNVYRNGSFHIMEIDVRVNPLRFIVNIIDKILFYIQRKSGHFYCHINLK